MRSVIQRTILSTVSLVTLAVSAASHADTVISGTVENATGAVIHISGAEPKTTSIGAAGAYRIATAGAGYHVISAREANTVFTPVAVFAPADSAVAGVNFIGVPTTSPTYKIAGTIGGDFAPGAIITLNGANVGSAGTDGGGTYSFSGLAAGTYTVSVSQSGYGFSKSRTIKLTDTDSIEDNFISTRTSGADPINLSSVTLAPQATVGVAYSNSLLKSVSGGTGAYHYQTGPYGTGTPPLGMVVGANGVLYGTPLKPGTYSFQLCAADQSGDVSSTCAITSIKVVSRAAVTPQPLPAPTPIPTPVPTTAAAAWVYYNGVFDWPGDYSFAASPDYTDTSGAPLSGAHDIKVTSSSWGGWLPYALHWNFNAAPYSSLTFSLKPTRSDQTWQVYFVKVGDIPVGIAIDVTQYGPTPVVGQWGTYTVPLKALGVAGTSIYKFAIQDQTGANDNTWYIDNVGFVN
jgi:hypothetical protein